MRGSSQRSIRRGGEISTLRSLNLADVVAMWLMRIRCTINNAPLSLPSYFEKRKFDSGLNNWTLCRRARGYSILSAWARYHMLAFCSRWMCVFGFHLQLLFAVRRNALGSGLICVPGKFIDAAHINRWCREKGLKNGILHLTHGVRVRNWKNQCSEWVCASFQPHAPQHLNHTTQILHELK